VWVRIPPPALVDPVTGLSRRALIALSVAVVVGIAASTVAGSIGSRGQPGCPDLAYRCATYKSGEPVVIGALFRSANGPEARALRDTIEQRGGEILGRRLTLLSWGTTCTPEGGTEGARELATDLADGPPVLAVIGGGCPAAAVPAAQILSDSGITLLLPDSFTVPPTAGKARYTLAVTEGTDPLTIAEVADLVFRAAEDLALEGDEDELLIPRTPLRDALARATGEPVR
jgi:hypothetical protein